MHFKSVEEGAAEKMIDNIIKKLRKNDTAFLGWITWSTNRIQSQNEKSKGASATNTA